ncbi:MAG: hypothetical protein ABW174_15555, partial [Flavitalea sp.]
MKSLKLNVLIILFLLHFSPASAQQYAPSIIWQKCLGGSGEDKAARVISLPNDQLLMVGSSKSNDGDVTGHHGPTTTTDAWVVKLSPTGKIIWQKSLGGTKDDQFKGAIVASDGNYLCFGTTESNDGDVTGQHGLRDI